MGFIICARGITGDCDPGHEWKVTTEYKQDPTEYRWGLVVLARLKIGAVNVPS